MILAGLAEFGAIAAYPDAGSHCVDTCRVLSSNIKTGEIATIGREGRAQDSTVVEIKVQLALDVVVGVVASWTVN